MNVKFRQLILRACVASLISVFSVGLVQAEDAPGTRIGVRGEITGVSQEVLKVHANSGENVVINLSKDTKVRAVTLANIEDIKPCLLYTSPSPRDGLLSRMPSSA